MVKTKRFVFNLRKKIVSPLKLKKGTVLRKRLPKGIKVVRARNINEAIRRQVNIEIRKELSINKKLGLG